MPSKLKAAEVAILLLVGKDHRRAPDGLNAYMLLSSHPTYTVPSGPTDGALLNGRPSGDGKVHSNEPLVPFNAYTYASEEDTYSVPSTASAGLVSMLPVVGYDHISEPPEVNAYTDLLDDVT